MSTNTSPRASGRSGRARADRPGVLVRAVLEELANSGALRNSEGGQLLIGQDTLKLHVGKIAWLAVEGDSRRTQVDPESPIRLPPGGIVTVVTQEEISVPLNLTGVIYPRGRLLPLGVLSTTVHVDPGFRGNCRVIVMNLGTKVVDIPYGYEVARLQLAHLTGELSTPYGGVNAELRDVNPQATDLVAPVEWRSPSQITIEGLALRVQHLEYFAETLRRRTRRVRSALLLSLGLLFVVSLALLAVLAGRSMAGTSMADLLLQVATGTIAATIALAVSLAQVRVRTAIRSWLSGESEQQVAIDRD